MKNTINSLLGRISSIPEIGKITILFFVFFYCPPKGGLGRGLSVCLSFCVQSQKGESLYAVWWWHCLSTHRMNAFWTADESLILFGCLVKLWRQCACSVWVKGIYGLEMSKPGQFHFDSGVPLIWLWFCQ